MQKTEIQKTSNIKKQKYQEKNIEKNNKQGKINLLTFIYIRKINVDEDGNIFLFEIFKTIHKNIKHYIYTVI